MSTSARLTRFFRISAPFRGLQIEREVALVAVDDEKGRRFAFLVGRPGARFVARPGVLDLDDVGPHVGQEHAAEGAGENAREIDDPDTVEREGSSDHVRYYNSMSRLREAVAERILVLDGAMGTMIQAAGLDGRRLRGRPVRRVQRAPEPRRAPTSDPVASTPPTSRPAPTSCRPTPSAARRTCSPSTAWPSAPTRSRLAAARLAREVAGDALRRRRDGAVDALDQRHPQRHLRRGAGRRTRCRRRRSSPAAWTRCCSRRPRTR